MTYPMITTDQYNALCAYARTHGRSWKSHLINDWMSGRCEGELQQLRNSHGPRWLKSIKLTWNLITKGD